MQVTELQTLLGPKLTKQLGKNGQNSAGPGNAGTAGAAIEGINYRVQANTWGSGDGDIRDNTINS